MRTNFSNVKLENDHTQLSANEPKRIIVILRLNLSNKNALLTLEIFQKNATHNDRSQSYLFAAEHKQ